MTYQKFLNLILNNEGTEEVPPFCIIKDRTEFIGNRECQTVWKLFRSPRATERTIIDKPTADRLIEKFGLIPALENKGSILYDTPDGDYQRTYRKFHVPEFL